MFKCGTERRSNDTLKNKVPSLGESLVLSFEKEAALRQRKVT
ncbi:hypothetical protein Hdeb2414_s0004g00125021 [Helianthus debilis subsp. tardiflorus]